MAAYVWRIQPVKLLEALEQGVALADVVAFLEARSPGPLPQNIAATFRETAERVAQLTDRGSAWLVEVQDPVLALLIANDRRLRSRLQFTRCRVTCSRTEKMSTGSPGMTAPATSSWIW